MGLVDALVNDLKAISKDRADTVGYPYPPDHYSYFAKVHTIWELTEYGYSRVRLTAEEKDKISFIKEKAKEELAFIRKEALAQGLPNTHDYKPNAGKTD